MGYDLIIRGGTVVDGTGAEPFTADVALDGDRIAEIGRVSDRGRQEIEADGLVVSPGFVDLHTHLDAQIGWGPNAFVRDLARRDDGPARQLWRHLRTL